MHLRVQRSQSSVQHSRALYVPSCRKHLALIPVPPPRIRSALKAAPSLPCQSVTASGLYGWALGGRGLLSLCSTSPSQPALPPIPGPRTSTPSCQQGAMPPAQGGKQVWELGDHPLTVRVCSDCCWALDRPENQVSSAPAEGEPSHLEIIVLCFLFLFFLLEIPEEHDLESQIRKEREWRFLRNTRVRKQAQQLIQKGKGCPQGPPWAVSRPPLALVQARNEAGGDAPGRKRCHCGAPLTCGKALSLGTLCLCPQGDKEALWDHRPRKLLSGWQPLGQS